MDGERWWNRKVSRCCVGSAEGCPTKAAGGVPNAVCADSEIMEAI